MKPRSSKNMVKGAGRELKGRAKEAIGKATGNTRLKVKGRVEGALGKAQRKVGEAEYKMEKENKRQTTRRRRTV